MKPLEILKRHYGHDSFRTGQEAVVNSILKGHDTFAIMPTGAGKSVCYQIPSLLMDGLSLVISPLISLMKDQVDQLREVGIEATYINSTLSSKEMRERLQGAAQGRYRMLYLAPERLSMDGFRSMLESIPLSLVTIDEAHCISQWGHDFRPSYRSVAQWIRNLSPRPVVAAFTATATQEVRDDISQLLGIHSDRIFITPLTRDNLTFSVKHGVDQRDFVTRYLKERPGETGIIYCATRKETDQVHRSLVERGLSAAKYHAGLTEEERRQAQEAFAFDRVQVMVATNAFGMGIDKSNVRFVIHWQMPGNLESYYQEAGRAGRDGEAADCILLFSPGDVRTQSFLIENGSLAPELKERERRKLQQMREYCHTQRCLQETLALHFGDDTAAPCGRCSNCSDQGEREDVTVEAQKIFSCVRRMRERYGVSLTAKVLKGSRDKRVKEFGLDRLPTYGLLRNLTEKAITHRIHVLAAEGYLRFTDDEFPRLTLTPAAVEVLKGERSVLLRVEKEKKVAAPGSAGLFEKLRERRLELSRREQIPPYMIFPDSTLTEMARMLPGDADTLLAVKGVGQQKRDKYGEAFLEVIREHAEQKDLPLMESGKAKAAATLSNETDDNEPSHMITWRLWQVEGLSLDEIQRRRELAATTLESHLVRCSAEGYPIDWDRLIPAGQEERVRQAIRQVGGTHLKPIKEALPDDISYTTIRAVLAKTASRS
ncbi:DNA helicase RecQ [Desmospora profundinema]|uniref:DNA helicase RecQ n=1 Tax=Desmospora profundinema TaxID=1571184 RepID=A0ABU1IIU3_9BACL|nr:DNA helicase RecQ [Desmospora profundinema]MDR6224682.1 ATP-dependent DNA helicase RecQ [Desmospora profundinema]